MAAGGPPQPGAAVPAEPSFDHRLVYLDYEGPVSGGRGTVVRWDGGTCAWSEEGGEVSLVFAGGRLRGAARLGPDAEGVRRLVLAAEEAATAPEPCPPPPPAPPGRSTGRR